MKFFISRLADEALGDELPRFMASMQKELAEFKDEAKGDFFHASWLDDAAMERGDIFIINGVIEADEQRAYIRKGFWKSGGVLEKAKVAELVDKEIKYPVAVDDEANKMFRELPAMPRQQ